MTPCAMSCKAHYVDLAGAAAVLSMYEGMILTGAWRDVVDAIVRCYVRANAKKLSPLSVREALKNTGFDQGYRQIRRTGRIHHGCLVVRSDCRSTGCFLEGFQDGVYFGLISCAL